MLDLLLRNGEIVGATDERASRTLECDGLDTVSVPGSA